MLMPQFIAEKNIDLFTRHQIFTKEEIHSRYEIILENYSKTIHIESLTMQDMVKKGLYPGALLLCIRSVKGGTGQEKASAVSSGIL